MLLRDAWGGEGFGVVDGLGVCDLEYVMFWELVIWE